MTTNNSNGRRRPKYYGIIPARYQSTRFPGKPLAEINGKPMFWHVYQRACRCGQLSKVVLATDDQRIFSAARDLDVPVQMTRSDHPSGTDRVLEAAQQLKIAPDAVVINIQGDEPALNPSMISDLVAPFNDPAVQVATLARPIDRSQAENPDRVKVVFSNRLRALYFSRSLIPFERSRQNNQYFLHIGLYGFRMDCLQRFVALKPGRLENAEHLEQLRLLENDIPIQIVLTDHHSIGVDRPEDLQIIRKMLQSAND